MVLAVDADTGADPGAETAAGSRVERGAETTAGSRAETRAETTAESRVGAADDTVTAAPEMAGAVMVVGAMTGAPEGRDAEAAASRR
jgi:hypothetical protein